MLALGLRPGGAADKGGRVSWRRGLPSARALSSCPGGAAEESKRRGRALDDMEAEGFGHRASWRGRCGSRREGDGAGGRGGNRVPIGGGEWRVKALDAAAAAAAAGALRGGGQSEGEGGGL